MNPEHLLSIDATRRLVTVSMLLSWLVAPKTQAMENPTRIIVGFAVGGPADALARVLAEKLRGLVASTVLVENRDGAGGRIAIEHVRNAAADGTVMMLTPDATMMLYPHVFRHLSYDPARDFSPVTRLTRMALAMFVGPMVPNRVQSVADYVQWVRAAVDHRTYGTAAAGATTHFAGAMFGRAIGLALTPVHYKGGAAGMRDLAGGQLPVFFGSVADGMALVPTGRVRLLAITGERRIARWPDVPTFAELGFESLVIEDGLGVYVPSKTSAARVAQLHAILLEAVKTQEVRNVVRELGFEISGEGPAEFDARLQAERKRWASIVRLTGFAAID